MAIICFDYVAHLISICTQKSEIHHPLGQILLLLIDIYVGYNLWISTAIEYLKSTKSFHTFSPSHTECLSAAL